MATYPSDLEIVQWAREATPGTDLPATSKMIVERFNPTPSTPDAYRPAFSRGLLLANRGGETVIQRGTDWSAEGPLTFEQAQHLFGGVIANVASPSGAGPYIWTHTRNPAAMPALAHYTFERRITDGSTPYDHAFHYSTFSDLELTFNTNEVWRYNANGFARRIQGETLTAALSLPAHQIALVPGTKIYLDSTWATLGTTLIQGQILSGRVRFGSGAAPRWTTDGRVDLDFGAIDFSSGRTTCEVEITMLIGAQYATEKAAAEALTLRAMRIQIDGSDATRQIQLDMLLKYRVPELFGLDYDDETTIVTLDLVGSTDGTNAWLAKVTNNVAAFA